MTTNDEHVQVLTEMAAHYENAHQHFVRDGCCPTRGIAGKYAKRAAAIRWILAETAYGVTADEVVT